MLCVPTSLRLTAPALFVMAAISLVASPARAGDRFPRVGETAKDFQLSSVLGTPTRLSDKFAAGPVVLVVLRGYPGYQCPACHKQVQELILSAGKLDSAQAQVLLVYPGPSKGLADKAREFQGRGEIPQHFTLLLDPDYAFTTAYGLRWDEPGETAYPSTFVLQPKTGEIVFAKIAKEHGGRARTSDVLEALKPLTRTR